MNRRRQWPVTRACLLRALCGSLGTLAWLRLWASPSAESPRRLFFIWLAAVLCWALALFSRWPVRRFGRGAMLCAGIVAVALVPRLLALSQAPFLVAFDEVIEPYYGIETLRARPWEIFSGTSGYFQQTNLIPVLQAWPCLFAEPLFGSRLASVVLGVISLVSTYALAHRLFGRRVALVALTLLAGSYWHMLYSRLAHPYMQPIALVPCVLYTLAIGMEHRNRFLLFLAGALVGVSLLVYTPARIVAPIAALWILHRAVMRRQRWREVALFTVVIALGMGLVYTPNLRSQGTADVLRRFRETAANDAAPLAQMRHRGWTSAEGREILATQLHHALLPYYAPGGLMAVGDFSPAPLLDLVTLTLVLIGCFLCVIRLADSSRFLLVVWIAATLLFGQVFTDMPAAAYRAAPMLPALAMAAGLGASTLLNFAARGKLRCHPAIGLTAWLALVALVLPPNVTGLAAYMAARRSSPEAGIARFIGAGPPDPIYYVVTANPIADSPVFRFLTPGKKVRDLVNVMDDLGQTIDPHRDAVFVPHPEFVDAAAAIRRCYPHAVLSRESSGIPESGVLALTVPAAEVAAGRNCEVPHDGPGLRARYFSGPAWDGTVVLQQIEDWPLRFAYDPRAVGSVEWSGLLDAPAAGPYEFQLYTGGPAVAEAEIDGVGTLAAGEVGRAELSAGWHALTVRCSPGAAHGFCWLRWRPPSGGVFATIPPRFLRPPPQDR